MVRPAFTMPSDGPLWAPLILREFSSRSKAKLNEVKMFYLLYMSNHLFIRASGYSMSEPVSFLPLFWLVLIPAEDYCISLNLRQFTMMGGTTHLGF